MELKHGQAILTDDGQVIMYKCRGEHKLWGSESATCDPNGLWTSPPPRCVRKQFTILSPYLTLRLIIHTSWR